MANDNQPETKKCPFCAEEISVDAVKCKHCGEWLNKQAASHISQMSPENTSGHGKLAIVPAEIKKWNWGAFFLNWIWGLGNRTYIALLWFIPLVNIVIVFVLGAKGSEWAWRNKRWDSVEHFQRVQKKWKWWGIGLWLLPITIGLLAALVGPKLFGKVGKAKKRLAKAQITLLGTSLDMYFLDVGRYPDTSEGLETLRKAPGSSDNWDGPYLDKEVPKDPWKRDYVYLSPGDHGEYDLVSYGADGESGGEGEDADISSWAGL